MDKLVAATRTTPPQNMTAVEDLKIYQKFAQAHVDGLKNLIVVVRDALRCDARCPEEDRRRGVRTSGRQG